VGHPGSRRRGVTAVGYGGPRSQSCLQHGEIQNDVSDLPGTAAEDRNAHYQITRADAGDWRPPSAEAEDRNLTGIIITAVLFVLLAATARGGRGSQLAEHEPEDGAERAGGRRSRRSRIATIW